jgi:flavin-dependent dehydrogenase
MMNALRSSKYESFPLADGSRVCVIGGGPAGSLTAFFLLKIADRIGTSLEVDIYEPKDFGACGPRACNMCGGIISESLVQLLAVEGINLPPELVQQGIDSYVLHTDGKEVKIRTPLNEMRIAALFRASGPKDAEPGRIAGLDKFLLDLACGLGARHVEAGVAKVTRRDDLPLVTDSKGVQKSYQLVVGAVGINKKGMQLFKELGLMYREPRTTRTAVMELKLGRENVSRHLGSSMHVFLLDIPGLEFAAIIPKGDYATVCVLGDDVDKALVTRFMQTVEVRSCLPESFSADQIACRCMPRINVGGARNIFDDRVVIVGDFGVTRLYKDGIGAAYRTAKACAVTALFHGVSGEDFRRYYWATPRRIEWDNFVGKLLFSGSFFFRKLAFLRAAMFAMTVREQKTQTQKPRMSMILWNMFTGSAPYQEVFRQGLMPGFLSRFALYCVSSLGGAVGRFVLPAKRKP